MYVCICHDINSKHIKKAIASGIDTMDALKDNLSVATCCGCCEPMVQDFLDEYHTSKNDHSKNSVAAVSRLAFAV